MQKPKTINYCKNSTISEAWAIVQGVPSPINQESKREIQALIHAGSKKYTDLKAQPLIIVGETKSGDIAPFWEFQGSWDNGKYIVRTGHGYLSTHRVCNELSKYGRYDTDVKPVLSDWLDLQNSTISNPEKRGVGSVGFGYINNFKFQNSGTFDYTKYLKLSSGVGVSNQDAELTQLKSSFVYFDKVKEVQYIVEAIVGNIPGAAESFEIVVQVYCEKRISGTLSLANKDKILTVNREIQKYAKEMFFDITTDETHGLMEVVYA